MVSLTDCFPVNEELFLANLEAETLILGGILFDPRAIGKVAKLLTPKHFYATAHQQIYETGVELHREGSPIDLMIMENRLTEKGLIEKVGGISYLCNLIERTVSAANIDRYGEIVINYAEKREIKKLTQEIQTLVNDRYYSATDLHELLTEKITALTTTSPTRSPVKLATERIKHILQTEPEEIEQNARLEELRQELKISPYHWENNYVLPIKQELVANKVIEFPKLSLDLLAQLQEINDKNLSESKLELELRQLAKLTSYKLTDLKKVYEKIQQEQELALDELELSAALPKLINLHKTRLDLHKVLPYRIADPIIQTAQAMPTAHEAIFTHSLGTWGSSVGTSSRIVVKASSKYIQPCIFRTMTVANSGDRKSPCLDIATEALEQLEDEAHELYKRQSADYEAEIANWSADKGDKPQKPIRRRFLVGDINYEGLLEIHQQNPRGLLNKVDELKGYFSRMNKFSNGRGDDDTKDLTLFGGKMAMKDRKTESLYLKRTAVSTTGTIQWDTLAELQSKFSDKDYAGTFARWLICATELPDPYLNLMTDDPDLDFSKTNKELIGFLRSLPEQDYLLSKEAKIVFQNWQHQLVRMMKAEVIPALEVAYPKFETYCVRLALQLHLVWGWDKGYVEPVISDTTVKRAIYATNWYMGQLRYVLSKNSPSLEIEGSALIAKDLLLKKNELTIRDLKRSGRSQLKKLSDAQLKSIFRSLVESGLAQYVTGCKTLKIKNKLFSDSSDSCSSEALTSNALTSLNGIDSLMTAPVSNELESLSNGHSEQSIIIDSLLTVGGGGEVCLSENLSKFEAEQKVDLGSNTYDWGEPSDPELSTTVSKLLVNDDSPEPNGSKESGQQLPVTVSQVPVTASKPKPPNSKESEQQLSVTYKIGDFVEVHTSKGWEKGEVVGTSDHGTPVIQIRGKNARLHEAFRLEYVRRINGNRKSFLV